MPSHEFQSHDHSHCVSDAMNAALLHCEKNGLKFTPVRQRVFEILLSEHKAMGAYDILEILAKEGMGSQPPVVYRALDFLLDLGLVHRLASINAYVGCTNPGHGDECCFLLCSECGNAQELSGNQLFSS